MFKRVKVVHADGSTEYVNKRVGGKAVLTAKQRATANKRKGKHLSLVTRNRISMALKNRARRGL